MSSETATTHPRQERREPAHERVYFGESPRRELRVDQDADPLAVRARAMQRDLEGVQSAFEAMHAAMLEQRRSHL